MVTITIQQIVWMVFWMILGAAILGLLWYAIDYAASKIGGQPMIWNIIRVVFVLLVIFLIINILLDLMGSTPIVRFR